MEHRLLLSATVTEFVSTTGIPANQITTDGTNLYFTGGAGGAGFVASIPLAGGPIKTLYTGLSNPIGIAVVNSSLFWADPNSGPATAPQVLTAPTSGAGTVTPIVTGGGDLSGLAYDPVSGKLFSSDEVNGDLYSLGLDGSGFTQVGPDRYSGGFSTEHLNLDAVSNGTVYVADSGKTGVDATGVYTLPTTGAPTFNTLHAGAPFTRLQGVTVGNGIVYVDDAAGSIWAISPDGSTSLISNDARFQSLQGLTYYNGDLYSADPVAQAIWQIQLTDTFTGNGDGTSWTDPKNWSTGQLPTPGEDAVINLPGSRIITLASGTQSIHGLVSSDPLTITGGSLAVATTAQVSANLTVAGGELSGGTYTATAGAQFNITGSSTLQGVTIGSDLNVTDANILVYGGLTLSNQSVITLTSTGKVRTALDFQGQGTQTLSGNGEVLLTDAANTGLLVSGLDGIGAATLAIGPGITVAGQGFISGSDTLVNQGSILANAPGRVLGITLSNFVNQGTAQGENGGILNLPGGGNLSFMGGTSTVTGVTTAASVSISGGDTSFVGTTPITVQDLTVSGGVLDGSAPLVVAKTATLTGGMMAGAGATTIALGATAQVSGLVIATRPLNNGGTITVMSGALQLDGGGMQSGTFKVAAGADLSVGGSAATPQTFAAGSSVTGNGTVEFVDSAPVMLQGAFNVASTIVRDQPSVIFAATGSSGSFIATGGKVMLGMPVGTTTFGQLRVSAPAAGATANPVFNILGPLVLGGSASYDVQPGAELVLSAPLVFLDGTPAVVLASSDSLAGVLALKGDVEFDGSTGSASIESTGAGANPGQIDLGGALRSFTIDKADTADDLSVSAMMLDGSIRKDGSGVLQLTSPSTYAAGTTATAGTLEVDNPNALGTGLLTFAGGVLALRTGGTPLPNAIQVNPTAGISLDVGSQALQMATPALGATLNVTGSAGGSLALNGPLALQHDLVVNDSVPVTINGTIGGNFGLSKSGSGTLTLGGNGSNSWTGATTVDGGTLALDKTGGTSAVPANVTINGPATVQLLQPNQIPSTAGVTFNDAAGKSVLDLNGQSQTLASLTSYQSGAGTVLLNGGMLSVADKSGFSGSIISAGPSLLSSVFNDGATTTAQTQRSEVRQIILTFNRAVTLASGAITLALWNSGGSGKNTGGAATDATAALGTATSSDGGVTWIVPILTGTAFSDATGSLSDGIYTVTLHATGVTAKTGGTALASDSSTNFHRLFGDINGDKKVNNQDYFQFNKAFGSATGSTAYNSGFDVNGDKMISNADYFQFNKRFGKVFTY